MTGPPPPPAIAADLPREEAARILRRVFAEAGLDTPGLDARLLAAWSLGLTAGGLLLAGREPVGPDGARRLAEAARRRLGGEPVARILGTREFWSLPFRLSPETLVPRPDTEAVVEAGLAHLPEGRTAAILDLGTGSGCILVALLHERPSVWGLGLDRHEGALRTARANAAAAGLGDRAAFVAADWAAPLAGRFDLVVANPPYIPGRDIPGLPPEVGRHDPAAALDGGEDGLDAYRAILPRLSALLAPGGAAFLEVGQGQADEVEALGRASGLRPLTRRRDLGGRERVVGFAADARGPAA